MKKRALLMGLIVVALIITILGFTGEKNIIARLNDNKGMKIGSVVNTPYTIRSNMSYVMKKDEIQSLYGDADIKRDAGAYKYEIRNIDNDSRLYVIYNSETGIVHDIWILKKLFKKEDFCNIKINTSTFEDVKKIDEYCTNFGSEGKDIISEHRMMNGVSLIVHYAKKDNDLIVKNMEYITDEPSQFTSILSQEDLEMIMPK